MEIQEFSPSIAHLRTLAEKYKGLKINGVKDKIGYSAVDVARKNLKRQRVSVTRTGTAMRAGYIQAQKKVITLEREAINIIEPLEKELLIKQLRIDNLKEISERIQKLTDIKVEADTEMLIEMTNRAFTSFYKTEREDYFDKLQEREQEKKREKEEAEKIEEAKITAKKEVEEEARIQASIEKQKSKNREAQILKEAEEREQAILDEAEKKQRVLSEKKVKVFLKTNNYNKETDLLEENNEEIRLYRLIGALKL